MKNKKTKIINNRNIIIIISIIIVFILMIIAIKFYNINSVDNEKYPDNYVARVIDGDTFQLNNKEIVRLICIDAPELGYAGSEEAKTFLESLILNKEVRLEKDISEKDKYNRLLRYVWVNLTREEISNVTQDKLERQAGEREEQIIAREVGEQMVFVNKEMVKQGYASVWRVEPDTKRCEEIEKDY